MKYWLGKHRDEGSKPPSRKGIPNSENQKRLISEKLTGIKRSEETRIKMSKSKLKGNIYVYPLYRTLRNKSYYIIWRELIFLRDNFTCQNKDCKFCKNKIGVYLHPHHIKGFAEIIKEENIKTYEEAINCSKLWDIKNGITYCKEFHLHLHNERKKKCDVNLEMGGKIK